MVAVDGQPPTRDTLPNDTNHAEIADLLSDLASQVDVMRSLFEAAPTTAKMPARRSNIVFVDDLAHCLECSWAQHEAADGLRIAPDVAAHCSRLLEASLRILQRVERLQADAREARARA